MISTTYHRTGTHNGDIALTRELLTSSIILLEDAIAGREAPDHGFKHEASEQTEPGILTTIGRRKGEAIVAVETLIVIFVFA